jgi:hypothetical protein
LQGSSTGTVAYSETQTISTNANGLVSLEIGSGSALAGTFAGINWATGPYFIKTETDPTGGTTYSITGTSQLMSVPYALFSASGTTGAQGIQGIQGLPGANGTNGTIGATGLTGATGAAGTNGANGLDGATGAAGTNGTNGLDGATGAAGTNGTNGLDGAIGLTGATGTDGAPGAAGAAGTNGATGLTGAAGINGADGATGLAGIDGADGATGLTGPEGAQGNTGAAGAANTSWSIDAGDNITNTNSGYTAISSDLDVGGNTNLNGPTTIFSDLNVAGTTVLNGPTAIVSDLNLLGVTTFHGQLILYAPIDIVSDLNVDGFTNLNGPTTIDNDLNVVGYTNLNGTTTIDNDLYVGGVTTLYGPSILYAPIDIVSDLNVIGFTNLNDLNVDGNASGMLQPSSAAHLTRKDYVDAANAANVSILNDLIAALEARIVALEQSQPQLATVGDFRVGGIVFWVDPADNTHGLVCALQDYPSLVEWGCYDTDLPSVPNVPNNNNNAGNPTGIGAEIGDGINNTNSILNDCPSAPAALAARSLGSEWFLPSAKELKQMYINRTTLEAAPGFSAFNSFYWSSTEYDSTNAYLFNFTNGLAYDNYKFLTNNVRGVRAF